MPSVPTVRIVNEDADSGVTVINEADYDPEAHTLADAAEKAAKPKPKTRRKAKSK
ncbi:MAG: hypothetical protein AAF791_02840 [Bacteroidota bacterium]